MNTISLVALIVPSWVATCPLTSVEAGERLTNMPRHTLVIVSRDLTAIAYSMPVNWSHQNTPVVGTDIITRLWGTGLVLKSHEVSDPGDQRMLLRRPACFITDAADPEGSNGTHWRLVHPPVRTPTTTHG